MSESSKYRLAEFRGAFVIINSYVVKGGNNEEISNIIRKKYIVRFVKARRISWIGHVERTEDSRMPKRVMREKTYTRRKRGRPKVRWLDDVQEDLREMGIEGWSRKAQDRDQWRRIAQEAKAHVGL
jgi:hypothetical protein